MNFAHCTQFHDDFDDDESPWMAGCRTSLVTPSSSPPSSPVSTDSTPWRAEIADRKLESDSYFDPHSSSHSPIRITDIPSASLPRRSVVSFRKKGNQVYSNPYNNAPAYQVRAFDGGNFECDLSPYHQPIHLSISNVSMDNEPQTDTPTPSPSLSRECASMHNFDFDNFITHAALNAQPRGRALSFAKLRNKSKTVSKMLTRRRISEVLNVPSLPPMPNRLMERRASESGRILSVRRLFLP